MSKDKIYKHLKTNVNKYESIFEDLINEEKKIELKIVFLYNRTIKWKLHLEFSFLNPYLNNLQKSILLF